MIYNDYELIDMVRENSDESRDILFSKYQPILKSIANEYYCKYKNFGYEYQDFVQEAYIAFQKAVINFNENSNTLFFTFVTLCVKRWMMSFVRKISCKQKNISLEDLDDIDNCVVSDIKNSVEYIYSEVLLNDSIKEIMYNFTIDVSSIMELRINHFSYSEISVLLDIPISTVEFRNRKIKASLKKKLY